jgi:hypothetical protein
MSDTFDGRIEDSDRCITCHHPKALHSYNRRPTPGCMAEKCTCNRIWSDDDPQDESKWD